MSYTSIRTAHGVGDVVYWYDGESDAVQRGVVIGIEARCDRPGYTPKFDVVFRVAQKYATDPGPAVVLHEDDVKESPRDAFPPIPPEAANLEAA